MLLMKGLYLSLNQVRTLHGSHVDFSMLGIKPDFVKVSWASSNLRFASSQLYSVHIPSSRKQVILTELNFLYLSNGQRTLVETKGELVSPNSKTVKKKSLIFPLITQEKPRNFWWGPKISRWWYPFFNTTFTGLPGTVLFQVVQKCTPAITQEPQKLFVWNFFTITWTQMQHTKLIN